MGDGWHHDVLTGGLAPEEALAEWTGLGVVFATILGFVGWYFARNAASGKQPEPEPLDVSKLHSKLHSELEAHSKLEASSRSTPQEAPPSKTVNSQLPSRLRSEAVTFVPGVSAHQLTQRKTLGHLGYHLQRAIAQASVAAPMLICDVETCRGVCDWICAWYDEIALDLEGVHLGRHGRICILQIAVDTPPQVFLFDITVLGKSAFDDGLRTVLETESIRKLIYDARADGDALHHLYGVTLANPCDLQVLHCIAKDDASDPFVKGLQKALDQSGCVPFEEQRWVEELKLRGKALFVPERGGCRELWEWRPLHPDLVSYCALDVAYLAAMRRKFSDVMSTDALRRHSQARMMRAIENLDFIGGQRENVRRDF